MTCARTSVIVPVYNAERYLGHCIESVLSQSHPPAEVLIVDDGSTDHSMDIAKMYASHVRISHQENLGPAAARNAGIRLAAGELLAFLDADDLWTPDKLEHQLAVLATDSTCEAVLGKVENFISPELDECDRRALERSVAQTGSFLIGALLIRRTAFLRVGWFDTRWRQGEFIEWWARATTLNLNYMVLQELVLQRRLHTDNMTRRNPHGHVDYLRLLREHLARRRKAATLRRSPTREAS
jgi:glycosyltransferase involved in cell wall biosynthesis